VWPLFRYGFQVVFLSLGSESYRVINPAQRNTSKIKPHVTIPGVPTMVPTMVNANLLPSDGIPPWWRLSLMSVVVFVAYGRPLLSVLFSGDW
jgi:hypothetical protein